MIVSRFAPSPTGRLHLGHAYSALLGHRLAREAGGQFLLRIEDIDTGRCRDEFVDGIAEDLRWLGLDWDGPARRQSDHFADYEAALDRLRGTGLIYRCTCTRADIAAAASAPHGPGGAVYPGTCRTAGHGAEQPYAWRLDMAGAVALAGPLSWEDATTGTVAAEPAPFGDVVLARKDAPASYHLAVTVDDALQGITDVVRGEDLFAATHVHRLLQALLGLPVPRYRHHRLLTGPDGRRLAKRDGAATIAALRAGGADPERLIAELLAAA